MDKKTEYPDLKENDQHINVFVRIKPMSITTDEKCMVEMKSDKEIIVYEQSQDRPSKIFTFDGIFGPSSTQVDVYRRVVSPLLKEVIAGYNCTVFAYGQTGTGKTYTMEGGRVDNPNWQNDTSAGMIPRCLSHLFDELQLLENQQYTVRVNFLELYNEELFDLLTDGNDAKIKLYEDVTKKGSVIIHGLEEVTVHSRAEIYGILERGSRKRQTAATLLNANSSRSHTVFSIMIHTKENTSGGKELLKTAKLNLVDLAGSEHISQSGILSVDKRARETKSINLSLLTLGRVITALVEKAPHVPYRESKLTRLLQESLGGRTKTSIIATISSNDNLKEMLSTLEYAHRAKNITNRPEINQKVCKRELLKEYTKEIERLKRDLMATREKNGVYVSFNDYDSMQSLIDCQRKEVREKRNYCKALEDMIESKEKIFNDFRLQFDAQVDEVTKNTIKLTDMNGFLQTTKKFLRQIECDKDEEKQLVDKYVETERIMHDQLETVLSVVNEASEDARKLHDKLDRKTKMEEENEKLGLQMRNDFMKRCENIEDVLAVYKKETHALLQSVKDDVEAHVIAQVTNIEASIRSSVDFIVNQHFVASKKLKMNINTFFTRYQKELGTHMQDASAVIEAETKLLTDMMNYSKPDILDLFEFNNNDSFMQNLQSLSRNIAEKLENVSMYAKHAVETICRNRLEEHNYLHKSLSEINEHINRIFQNEEQIVENYNEFGKKMKNLSCGLNILDTCERNYSENIDMSHRIYETCSNIDQNLHGYNIDTIKQNDLMDVLQNTTLLIKSDIDSGINQMQISNKATIEKGIILITDLRKHLNTAYDTLNQYNNNVQFIGNQLQKKMAEEEQKILISNTNMYKIIEDMGLTHVIFMKKQQNKISEVSKMIDDKFTYQHMKLNNCNNNVIEELRASQHQIDKFLTEDFCRDVYTGTTPERKSFSYPRELVTMSPPERVIQRFREDRNYLNEAEDNLDLPMTEQFFVSKINSIEQSSNENHMAFVTSTPYNNPNCVSKKIKEERKKRDLEELLQHQDKKETNSCLE